MPVRVTCSECEKSFRIADDRRGKAVACKCGAKIQVPPADDVPEIEESFPEEADASFDSPEPEPAPRRHSASADTKAQALRAGTDKGRAAAEAGAKAARAARAALTGGALKVLLPPGPGAVRMLWLGLLLLIIPFAIKSTIVSWAVSGVGGTTIEGTRLGAKLGAKMDDLALEAEEIEFEQQFMERPKDDASADDKKSYREDQEKLDKELEELRKEQREERRDLQADYLPDIREASNETAHATAFALRKLGWLRYKWILDIAKLVGTVLVLFSAFHIVTEPDHDFALKAFAVTSGSLTLASILLGGLLNGLIG
ncbi:MAG: prefoldin domain-containing protein [Planctomycetota bacterium]|jgi:DNA-directed RNA polymerase subunit RPC12/RpoP